MEAVLWGLSTNTCWVAMPVFGSKKLAGILNSLAGIVAVSLVLDTNVVVIAAPFHITVLPLTKFVPVAVNVNANVIPFCEVLGLMDVNVGAGPRPPAITVSGSVPVVDLSGLVTPTLMVPADATSAAGTVAWSWVAESKVVVAAVPLSVIAAAETNPVPVAVSVKDALPAATAAGEIEVRLKGPPLELLVIVSVIALELVLSDFITRILTAPALAICAALTLALSWVDELTVVGSEPPSHRSIVPWAKLVPVAVSVNPALPAVIVVGLIDDRVGESTP